MKKKISTCVWDYTDSMTSTRSVEVKATIDTGLPWKVVATKGSRSSTRRTKKQIALAAAPDIESDYKSSAGTAAEGDSESEKVFLSFSSHFVLLSCLVLMGFFRPHYSNA